MVGYVNVMLPLGNLELLSHLLLKFSSSIFCFSHTKDS